MDNIVPGAGGGRGWNYGDDEDGELTPRQAEELNLTSPELLKPAAKADTFVAGDGEEADTERGKGFNEFKVPPVNRF